MATVSVTTGNGGAATTRLSAAWPTPPPFTALSITLKVPVWVGAPEMMPVPASTLNPAGNPLAPKEIGELVAVIWYVKAVPVCASAVSALLIVGGWITGTADTVRVSAAVPCPPEFVALSVIAYVPTAVGVPEIKPLPESTLKPAGRPAAPNSSGLLLAVIW